MIGRIIEDIQYRGFKGATLEWHDRTCHWIARHLPRRIIYWATIHLFGHATTGQWGNTHPDMLNIFEALKRWDIKRED